MTDTAILQYVQTTAALIGIPMDDARAARVADHFGRTVAMAAALEAHPLPPDAEPAEVYRPAPFPATDASSSVSGDA